MSSRIRTHSGDHDLVNQRREHIRKRATALFAKQPFDSTNMRQMLDHFGMSKGALYHYVGSKEDIRTLILEYMASVHVDAHLVLRERIANMNATEALREVIRFTCERFDALHDEIVVLTHEMGNLSRTQREPHFNTERENVALILEILQKGIETGEFQIDDAQVAAHSIHLMVHAWAVRRWYLRKLYTLEEYIRSITEFVMKSVRADTQSGCRGQD